MDKIGRRDFYTRRAGFDEYNSAMWFKNGEVLCADIDCHDDTKKIKSKMSVNCILMLKLVNLAILKHKGK